MVITIRDHGLLLYIIKHCNRIEEKLETIEEKDFYENEDVQEIICFNLFQIGELVVHLSDDFINEYNQIPWVSIRGMRNRIGHGYGSIKLEDVWNAASKDIKPLKDYCKSILNSK